MNTIINFWFEHWDAILLLIWIIAQGHTIDNHARVISRNAHVLNDMLRGSF